MFPALRSYGCNLSRFAVRVPSWRRTAATPAMGAVCSSGLGAGDLAHGVVEGQAEDLGTEVNPSSIVLLRRVERFGWAQPAEEKWRKSGCRTGHLASWY